MEKKKELSEAEKAKLKEELKKKTEVKIVRK